MSGLFRLFGLNEFTARTVSALAGVGVVAVIYGIGKRQRGPVCGLIAALILLTTFQFVQMSRLVNTDVLLVFFIFLALFGYLHVRDRDRRWWYVVSVSCAFVHIARLPSARVAHFRSLHLVWDRRRVAIRVAIVLVCAWFMYEAIGKIRSYYVRIEGSDEGVKELASLAAAQSFPQVLIVYSRTGEFDPQAALFYSNKRVLQATGGARAYSSTLYHNYKPLADVAGEQPSGIILAKDDVASLLADYTIDIVGESHNLVYATIRKK